MPLTTYTQHMAGVLVPVPLLCLLFLSGTASPDWTYTNPKDLDGKNLTMGLPDCSYQKVLEHLKLNEAKEVFTTTRPVCIHTNPTQVELNVYLYAILSLIEKTQTFIPVIWLSMKWKNEWISWNESEFCNISRISVPKEMLWKPDLFIYEMTQKDESPPSPYLTLEHNGNSSMEEVMRLVLTCKMDVYLFPFDTQRCNITFGSAIHQLNEMTFTNSTNSSVSTERTCEVIQKQGEWEFLKIDINKEKKEDDSSRSVVVYTISMKRRPLLYITNLMLPILFFLLLDLASFLISNEKGEKLGFKVTVLLAVSVLLLILKDILPPTSNRTPLIATYCIVTFAFLLVSLLETIIVIHLIEKDFVHQETGQDHIPCHTHDQSEKSVGCVITETEKEAPCEPVPFQAEVIDDVRMQSNSLLILENLRAVQRMLALFASSSSERKPGYWTALARRINVVFFTIYLISVILFLIILGVLWSKSN